MSYTHRMKKMISRAMSVLLVTASLPMYGYSASAALTTPAGSTVLVNESFESYTIGQGTLAGPGTGAETIAGFTSMMANTNTSADTISIAANPNASTYPGLESNVVKITNGGLTADAGIKKELSGSGLTSGNLTIEYDFSLSDRTKNSALFRLLDASGSVVVELQNKNISSSANITSGCTNATGAIVGWFSGSNLWCPLGSAALANNSWYHLKAVLDLTARQGSYYLYNAGSSTPIGQLEHYPFKNASASTVYKTIAFSTLKPGSAYTLYLDNIQAYQAAPAPSAPTNVSAAAGDAQVALTWDTVTGATYYVVKRSQNHSTGGAPYTTIGANVNGTSYTDSTAENGTKYFYVVTASNGVAESANSSEVSATPVSPAALAAPAVTATPGDGKVDLAWSSVTNATYYKVKRSTDGISYTNLSSNVPATGYTDTTAANGTAYTYIVTAANATAESTGSTPVSATPAAPAIPAAPLNVGAIGKNGQIIVTWNAVQGAASYNVKQSLTPGGPYTIVGPAVTGTSFTQSGLTNGTAYYYTVSAVNAVGESGNSAEASDKPGLYLINDNFESDTLGEPAPGFESIAATADVAINNVTVINNANLTNKYYSPTEVSPANNKSATVKNNSTNVLWINDNANAGRRGGFTYTFAKVSGQSGLTAQLDFMQPKIIGDSYPLELLDGSGKTVLSFSVTNLTAMQTIEADKWYTLKFVADTGTNSADVYLNGAYKGNYVFSTQDTGIAKIQARTAGSSTGSMYVDNVKVYKQQAVTPQKVTTEGANSKVVLKWNAASGADSYNVYRSAITGGPYEQVAGQLAQPTYTDAGLTNKTKYYYVVTSSNASGEGDPSHEAVGYPNNVQPPAAAPVIAAPDIRDSQLTLSWSAVTGKDEDNTDVASTYTVYRSTTPNGPFETPGQNLTVTAFLDKGLTNGISYYYKVVAQNMGGTSPASELLKVAPAASLTSPTLLQAAAGDRQTVLGWSPVPNATAYSVKRSELNGRSFAEIGRIEGTSYTDSHLTNGTAYYYVVTAIRVADNGIVQESAFSNQGKAVPYSPAAGAPTAPSVIATASKGSVSLAWQPVPGAASYSVKRSTTSGGAYQTLTSTGGTTYPDASVTNGTTYYYVVTAVNASGESQPSEEIAAVPAKVLTVDKTAQPDAETFNTIQSAVNSIPVSNTERTVIFIKEGTYTEKLVVNRPHVSLIGEGMDKTRIVYGDYAGTSATAGRPGHTGNTFLSQTVEVNADYFTAANLTIENSAGPRSEVAQAVALSLKSDMATFESVKLIGYQDTLYTGLNASNQGRHYFHNSVIQGDVDFIFGEAPAAVFDNVKLVLVSNSGGGGHITAAAQKNASDIGYVFLNSQIVDDASAQGTYDLGRPWKDYANVKFINTLIDSQKFLGAGWLASCAGACITSSFAEYNSYGPGANASARQIAVQLTGKEASLTVPQIFGGWDPTSPLVMPKLTLSPSVKATASLFDKNAANQSDLQVTIQENGNPLTGITNGGNELAASDYSVTGSIVTIHKSYLAGLAEGPVKLEFNFGSAVVPLTVQIVNTSVTDIGRQVLAVNDGWGAYSTGTTGGSKADQSHTYTVSKRSELIQALGGSNGTNATNATPKIIYINGAIDMNVNDNDVPMGMDDYKDPRYDFAAYLQAYDPDVWGRSSVPSGALETARANSEANQGKQIKINVGANTTIVGLPGTGAKLLGANLMIQNVDNVIVRNIEFINAFDYFPQWDPTDGEAGNWNSAFDNITVKNATHIWIDHNTFHDGVSPDDYGVKYFGRQYQQHDGTLDISNASDLITVSYNYFHDHDKTTLVGGSDSYTADRGKERITFHHNYYRNVSQRGPRVRFGQVHIYNNYYEGTLTHPSYPFLYAIGVGFESQVYAQNNYFSMDQGTQPASLIQVSPGGTMFTDAGSMLNGQPVQIAQSKGGLSPVNWTPTLYTSMDASTDVPFIVRTQAGSEHTQPAPFTAPSAPTGLTATAGDGQVGLTWGAVTGATSYTVKRSITSGGPYTAIATDLTNASYTDVNAANGTTYYYVVTAGNLAGESLPSSEVSATPQAAVTRPNAPRGLTATAGNGQVSLTWETVTGATYYTVKRSMASGGSYSAIASDLTNPSYRDVNLFNGTTYYYVVTATNQAGESAASGEAGAMPVRPRSNDNGGAPSAATGGGSTNAGATVASNGKSTAAITAVPVKELNAQGTVVLKVTLDSATLQQAFDAIQPASGSGVPTIEIKVQGSEPAANVQLPADALVKAQGSMPTAVIVISFGNVTYKLPVTLVNVAALAQAMGVKPGEVTISVKLEKVSGAAAAAVNVAAKQNGVVPVSDTYEFGITVEAGGKSQPLNDFGQTYVSRTIQLSTMYAPNAITAVMVDPVTGAMTFVPATVTVVDGVTTVAVKRNGNSLYTVVQPGSRSFDDLKGHWSQEDVSLLASKLIVQGETDKRFAPDHQVTRAEFAAMLVRGLGLSEAGTSAYPDVKATDWFAGTVGAAAKAKLVEGFEDGTFRPSAPVTREQMAVMIARALQFTGQKAESDNSALKAFADSAAISGWAKDSVSAAAKAGIVNGLSDGTFKPADQASRAQAAVMLKRLLQAADFINK